MKPKLIQSKNITSYDVLKSFAVIIMVIDHLGFYFFPEYDWLRSIGRICVPIWFFLVGRSQSLKVGLDMPMGALILSVFQFLILGHFLPLNVLWSMTIWRVFLRFFPKITEMKVWGILLLSVLCVIGVITIVPTSDFVEYGSLGFLLALAGYCCSRMGKTKTCALMCIFVTAFCSVFEAYYFKFSILNSAISTVGISLTMLWLWNLQSREYLNTEKIFFAPVLRFIGRETLSIYVVNHVIFMYIRQFI